MAYFEDLIRVFSSSKTPEIIRCDELTKGQRMSDLNSHNSLKIRFSISHKMYIDIFFFRSSSSTKQIKSADIGHLSRDHGY